MEKHCGCIAGNRNPYGFLDGCAQFLWKLCREPNVPVQCFHCNATFLWKWPGQKKIRTRTILFRARIRQWPDMASLSYHVRASPGFNAAHRVAPGDADGGTARTAHARGVEVVLNASDANTLYTESSFFAVLVNGESVRPPLVTAHRTVRPAAAQHVVLPTAGLGNKRKRGVASHQPRTQLRA